MRDHWKDRVQPNIDDVISLFENEALGAFMTGHLILESVLVQLIELKLTPSDRVHPFDMSFPSKVEMAVSRQLIDGRMAEFLLEVNRLRNRLAHRLREPIDLDRVFALAQKARAAGVDFSDSTIHSDKATSRQWYGVRGIIQEIFQNASQDLAFLMEDHGGKFQFC